MYTRAPRPTSSPSDESPKPRWCGDCSRRTSVFFVYRLGTGVSSGPQGTSKQTFRQFLPQISSCVCETLRVHFEVPAPSARRWWPAHVLHSAREVRGTGEWRRSAVGNDTRQEMTNHVNAAPPILLTIAGFDPSCGAGTAADLKTFSAHNCYGVAAITALTVQSTQGVLSAHITHAPELRAQLDALAADVGIAAVKIGMLGNRPNAAAVAEFLDQHQFPHVVLDTPFKSSSGAELLAGMEIKDLAAMEVAARKLVELGARAVILKGGHMEKAVDVLFDGADVVIVGGDRVKSENTHGTGCTFASAIAAQLALGHPLQEAAMLAKAYVMKAIERSFPIGKGHGPLDHFYRMRQEPPARGVHEVPQHGLHPAAEPAAH